MPRFTSNKKFLELSHCRHIPHVCVFMGVRTPFVIRKASSVLFGLLHAYRLVGECYVEGLMRKEALDMKPRHWGLIFLE